VKHPKKRKANSGTLELYDRRWMAESTAGVVSAILTVYDKLPVGGKPRDDEYTVLAAIVAVSDTGEQVVVSLATGTKCIGRDFDNKAGCLLSDSHAEVVARRGFIRYLHEQLRKMVDSPSHHPPFLEVHSSSADVEHPKIALKAGWKLVLYASDSPCGDAALYEANLSGEAKVVTGAKPCAEEGAETVGCVRTKSGRSDIAAEARTSSMSCSDKISRWSYLGLQGYVQYMQA
jgi:tRNA-specific adenosine deaminase 1